MGYTLPLEVYEAIRKVVKDENVAKEVIKTIEKSLEVIEDKAKEQKVIVKAELKDELRKELVTKEEFFGEIGKLRQEIETIRQELKGEIRELRIYMKFLIILLIIGFTLFNPNFFELLKLVAGMFK
ncbi:MAG: hypothetical protein DSY35_02955 [Desulfurobacterium sp.]|nr:MAG: hypothetical protein DSY35_02955 [Desulfurobacterium sp.]